MAIVRLKRNWFGPNGVRYRSRDGLIEIPDEHVALLPSDAEVYNGQGLPSKAPRPMPGFGAKPLHEQTLDLIPFAAPTHQQAVVTSETVRPVTLSESEQKKHDEAAEKASDALAEARDGGKSAEDKQKETQAAIQKGIDLATAAVKEQDKVLDPIATASAKTSGAAPAKTAEVKK